MTRSAMYVRWVLGVAGAIFLGLGLACIFVPSMIIGAMDVKAEPGKALADIRAVYGGLDLAIGILLIYFFVRKQWSTGLAISTLVCACLAAGRLVGILIDPARDILTFGLFGVEVLGAVLSAVGLFLARQPEAIAPVSASPVSASSQSAAPAATATELHSTETTPEV